MKTHDKCPNCAGRDPYRETITITATEPGKARAVRMREAWRAFWRHRGEEWFALPEPFRFKTMIALALLSGAVALYVVGALMDRDCNKKCGLTGLQGTTSGPDCYCVEGGRIVRWYEVGRP